MAHTNQNVQIFLKQDLLELNLFDIGVPEIKLLETNELKRKLLELNGCKKNVTLNVVRTIRDRTKCLEQYWLEQNWLEQSWLEQKWLEQKWLEQNCFFLELQCGNQTISFCKNGC
jgi:hypothetical protein